MDEMKKLECQLVDLENQQGDIEEDTIKGDTIKGDTIKEDTIKGDTIKEDTIKEDTIKKYIFLVKNKYFDNNLSLKQKSILLIDQLKKKFNNTLLFLDNYGILISLNNDISSFNCSICNSQKKHNGRYEPSPHPTNILNINGKIICTCPCLLTETLHYSGNNMIGCNLCKNKFKPNHTQNYCPLNKIKKELIVYWKILIPIEKLENDLNQQMNNLSIC